MRLFGPGALQVTDQVEQVACQNSGRPGLTTASERPGEPAADTVGSGSRAVSTQGLTDVTVPPVHGVARAGLSWVRPRLSGCYGVIAMAPGSWPTWIGLRAVLVAVLIGITTPSRARPWRVKRSWLM